MRTGILLLNFGGPWTLADVKPFLYRLFANKSVLVGVPSPLRQILAFMIAHVKGPSSRAGYKSIGGGSPQLKWTSIQAEGLRNLERRLDLKIEFGMRSAEPSIEVSLERLRLWGAEKLILLPLFPQYSTTTTGTCFEEADDALRRLQWSPEVHQIVNWPDHPFYIQLLKATLNEALEEASSDRNDDELPAHVIFSAHSLPLKIVERGDPYPEDVQRTVQALTRDLKHPWSVAFQSRNGKLPWLQPYLEDELKRLGKEGVHKVVIVPISFVSDHIETLFELDQLYAGLAKECGITHYRRARCFNADPRFPQILHALLSETYS
ncbi:MAG TPA: ferrochelatase [Pyrinomonadaceae bacterium]|nr:ferrochelatase [Pyrinomonadaceae bacterium]